MISIILAIFAGVLISIQSIFNAKVNEYLSHWLTTTIVLGLGFITSLLFYIVTEKSIFIHYETTNYMYYMSGLFGIGIVICMMKAISLLGPAYTILISLISQLTIAMFFDALGLFGLEKVAFPIHKLLGILLLIIGVGIFSGVLPYKKSKVTTEN